MRASSKPEYRLWAIVAIAIALLVPASVAFAAPGKTPRLDRLVAGKIFMDDDPEDISDSLASELSEAADDFTEAVILLLEGAAKAKSPKSACDLIDFCFYLREEIAEADAPPERTKLDLERTRSLWKKLLDDQRTYGLLKLANAAFTVSDAASAMLESLATAHDDEDTLETVWALSGTLGGHRYKWLGKRAHARLAGDALPPLPDARTVDQASRAKLSEEFLKTLESHRPGWLAARTPAEILALRTMASENSDLGKGLLATANAIISNRMLTKEWSAVASDWKPKSASLDKGFIEEVVARAAAHAKAGEYHQFTIERGAGFTGVEVLQQPWNDKLDLLADRSWEDPGIQIILRNLGVYRLSCEGVLLLRVQFDGAANDDPVRRSSIWPVAIRPELPAEIDQWKKVVPKMAEKETEQQEFVDFLVKAFEDAKSAGNGIHMELYAFPARK